MALEPTAISISPAKVLEFLKSTPPFNNLGLKQLEELSLSLTAESYPQGASILQRGKSPVTHLRLIYQGSLKLFLVNEDGVETMQTYRGAGDSVGALGILLESLSNLNVMAMENTTCLLLAREDFLRLIENHSRVSQYYLKLISEDYASKALVQLQRPSARFSTEGTLYLFTAQVGDIVRERPVTIAGSESVQKTAQMMNERRVGCLLVTDSDGKIKGIVTDRDLRTKVVALGQNLIQPVEAIMSSPVQTISTTTVCFDALLEMMRRRVHHLVLEKNEEIVGVISGHDLMVLQGTSPLYLVRQIMAQDKIEDLYDVSLKSPRVVRNLIYEGAKPNYITRMITLINDYILDRLLTLLQERLGTPPVPFCWMLMGSEGRREQTFRTDQDNGLLYADPSSEAEAKQAAEYFAEFGQQAIEHLVACGFPRCKGNIMASNPTWCQPYSVWRGYFDRWITTSKPKDVLHATIFFDFRPGYGSSELGERLRNHLMREVKRQDVFLRFLARDCLTTLPPINFFRQFTLIKEGEHKNKLDLKTKGLVPFVDFARILSLKHGISETNTLERLQQLSEGKHISHELFLECSQAYEFQMQLRLIHQQMMDEEGLVPDNYIDPYELSDIERRTLKEAFGVINAIKSYLKDAFRLTSG